MEIHSGLICGLIFAIFQVGLSENNSKQVQFVVQPKYKVKTEGEIVSTHLKNNICNYRPRRRR